MPRPTRLFLLVLIAGRGACVRPVYTPSLRQISHAVRRACAALEVPEDMWLEPEDAAYVAARAISALAAAGALEPGAEESLMPLAPQGEYRFAAANTPEKLAAATRDRSGAVEAAAHGGDGLAMQTLGLLHYNGVGAASWDERESAYWHAAGAAAGNVEALATLGGCVRRGVGAEQDEASGVAIIAACAAAGSAVGLCKLGVLYDEGELPSGLPPDAGRAAELFAEASRVRFAGFALAASDADPDAEPQPLKRRKSALGLFQHGFALMYGTGVPRDIEAAAEAWLAAAKLAPDDGAEEAAWGLYNEQVCVVCVCVCVCVCVYIYIYIYILYMCVCIYIHICIYIYIYCSRTKRG